MSESPETKDEVMEEVRAVREAYAARFDYDVAAIFRHAQERVRQSERKVVKRQAKPARKVTEAP